MRIGHISDLHLRHHLAGTSAATARRSRQMPELLREAVARLSTADVDLVAVTGDLVDHPHDTLNAPESLRDGAADLRLVADLLAPLPCPWVALPGNHDHPHLFADIFGMPAEIEVAGHRVIAFHDWDTDDPAAPPPPEAAAHVPHRRGDERTRFATILAGDDPRPQVHLQHYVITPRLDEGWPHTYADGEALCAAVAADGRVHLALSGHYHPGTEAERVAGDAGCGTWFAVAPAFCQVPHAFLLYDLDDAGGLTTTRVELRPDPA